MASDIRENCEPSGSTRQPLLTLSKSFVFLQRQTCTHRQFFPWKFLEVKMRLSGKFALNPLLKPLILSTVWALVCEQKAKEEQGPEAIRRVAIWDNSRSRLFHLLRMTLVPCKCPHTSLYQVPPIFTPTTKCPHTLLPNTPKKCLQQTPPNKMASHPLPNSP